MEQLQAQMLEMTQALQTSQAEVARIGREAEAQIAQLRTQLGAPPPPPRNPHTPIPMIDTRMLTKPRSFTGKPEDWSTFATVTRAYCGALDQRLVVEMKAAEMQPSAILNDSLPSVDPEDKQAKIYRSMSLYYLLIMLCQGRPLSIAEICPENEGMELWRRLVFAYDPKATTRSAAILLKVLNWKFDVSDFLSSLEKWGN